MTKPVTGDAEIRPGEKFAEDALAQPCEMQRESIRKMQTALDLQDSELRELKAARAGLMQKVEDLTNQLSDRRIPGVSAMATDIFCHSDQGQVTHKQMVCAAAAIYAETEKQLGGAK